MFTNRLSDIEVSKIRQVKNFIEFESFRCKNNGNLKNGRFSAKIEERGFVSFYTDRLLANQIARKPVRISCHYNKVGYYLIDSL